MKKIQTNNLKDFTSHYLNTEIKDLQNARAMRDLRSPNEKDFFAIQRTDLARELIQFPIPPHRVDFYELLIIEQGINLRSVDLHSFELRDKSFSLTKPGQIVSDDLLSPNIKGYHLYFDQVYLLSCGKDILQIPLFDPLNNSFNSIEPSHFKEITPLLFKIEHLYIHESNEPLLKSYLSTLMLELNTALPKISSDEKKYASQHIAERFRRMISLEPHSQMSISQYAEKLNTTSKKLNAEVKRVYSKTPLDLKTESIMTNAQVMLNDPETPISEIAYHLGFEDIAYFSRFFKKHFKKSPSEYRNIQKKEA